MEHYVHNSLGKQVKKEAVVGVCLDSTSLVGIGKVRRELLLLLSWQQQ